MLYVVDTKNFKTHIASEIQIRKIYDGDEVNIVYDTNIVGYMKDASRYIKSGEIKYKVAKDFYDLFSGVDKLLFELSRKKHDGNYITQNLLLENLVLEPDCFDVRRLKPNMHNIEKNYQIALSMHNGRVVQAAETQNMLNKIRKSDFAELKMHMAMALKLLELNNSPISYSEKMLSLYNFMETTIGAVSAAWLMISAYYFHEVESNLILHSFRINKFKQISSKSDQLEFIRKWALNSAWDVKIIYNILTNSLSDKRTLFFTFDKRLGEVLELIRNSKEIISTNNKTSFMEVSLPAAILGDELMEVMIKKMTDRSIERMLKNKEEDFVKHLFVDRFISEGTKECYEVLVSKEYIND